MENYTGRRRKKGRQVIWIAAASVAAAVLLVVACDSRLVLRTYTVETEKLSGPVRLVVLTDLHSCRYGEDQQDLLGLVAGLSPQPDAVLLAGDIVDDELPEENAWTTIAGLAEAYPCFYVTGNHEWRGGEAERICVAMEDYGVTVLRGETVDLAAASQTIRICGIDDPDAGAEEQLAQVGTRVEEETFSVLLAHRPERIEEYLRYPFDLIVSGHAHGGQWRIPGLLNGLFAPNQGLFPQYAGGQYSFENATLIVSRGLARESTRIPRIFNRPEVVVVDLAPE